MHRLGRARCLLRVCAAWHGDRHALARASTRPSSAADAPPPYARGEPCHGRSMLTGIGLYAVAFAAAFALATLASPVGVSGAVLLLPFQVGVLGTPSPAVTPTNLLYNVVATPAALYRYRRQQQTGGRLALILITGTLPGVIVGSVIRVELLPGPRVFDLLVAALLLPLGFWLAASRPDRDDARPARQIP